MENLNKRVMGGENAEVVTSTHLPRRKPALIMGRACHNELWGWLCWMEESQYLEHLGLEDPVPLIETFQYGHDDIETLNPTGESLRYQRLLGLRCISIPGDIKEKFLSLKQYPRSPKQDQMMLWSGWAVAGTFLITLGRKAFPSLSMSRQCPKALSVRPLKPENHIQPHAADKVFCDWLDSEMRLWVPSCC